MDQACEFVSGSKSPIRAFGTDDADILVDVSFAAGQFAEQEPDGDDDADHDCRNDEELYDEPCGGGLDRRKVTRHVREF